MPILVLMELIVPRDGCKCVFKFSDAQSACDFRTNSNNGHLWMKKFRGTWEDAAGACGLPGSHIIRPVDKACPGVLVIDKDHASPGALVAILLHGAVELRE